MHCETTYNDDLEPNDDKGSFVKADTIYQETGAHARGETTQTAEGGPEASDKTVHCRIIRISSIPGDHYGIVMQYAIIVTRIRKKGVLSSLLQTRITVSYSCMYPSRVIRYKSHVERKKKHMNKEKV